jgi:hypothetical protein
MDTIRHHALGCFELLNASLKDLEGLSLEKPREQLGCFSLWASNIGVFAKAPMSLDYRLRDAPEISETLIGMLSVLSVRIHHGELYYSVLK